MKLSTSSSTSRFIIGVSWRKLTNKHSRIEDDECFTSPKTRSRSKLEDRKVKSDSELRENRAGASGDEDVKGRVLTRVKSVRDAVGVRFGTLRQKLRTSTRRKKRLYNMSPYTTSRGTTPTSMQRRRSARLAMASVEKGDVRLYSPFCIDTPGNKTPSRIRMGVHPPKRFNFSSPEGLQRDLDSVAEGMRALTSMENNFNNVIDRQSPACSGIRTTPAGRSSRRTPQNSRRKAIFV